jgi:4-hydroxy-3-polyprenylbenzoate decarboxylase
MRLPRPFDRTRLIMPGVLAVEAPAFGGYLQVEQEIALLDRELGGQDLSGVPLLVLCDDAGFVAETLSNFIWATFTRSNPRTTCTGSGASSPTSTGGAGARS